MSKRLKIVSWNINSVRARTALVERLIAEQQPDILCLQETKVLDSIFPADLFHRHGYVHSALNGQRMHHGVAILSRVPIRSPAATIGRTMAKRGTLECGWSAESGSRMSMSPPAGIRRTASVNPKFGQKLDFIERMTRWSEKLSEPTIIVGDFNVAPLECDVWSHKALLTVVSHTAVEVAALDRLQQAHEWIDIGRKFVPSPERCFTWWSYRSPDWTKNDRGRRLDHMWASPELAGHLAAHHVLEPCRNWQRPSDHVPLICEIEV